MKNKGAVSVLLAVILLAMITAIGAAVDVCSLAVAKAYSQRISYLACKSVLAEYDKNLFEDYGLMGFDGGKDEIKERVEYYTSLMGRIDEKSEEELVFFDIISEDISIDCGGRNLCDKTVFMGQVRELMKLKTVENGAELLMDAVVGKVDIDSEIIKAKQDMEGSNEMSENGETDVYISDKGYDAEEEIEDRVLRSKRVIDSLPSKADMNSGVQEVKEYNFGNEDELMALGEECSDFLGSFYSSLSAGADKFLLIDYADEYFKNAVKETSYGKETFFENEMEYLLKGYMSDKNNLSSVKKDMFLLRTALNLAHIYSDPNKCRLVLETAAGAGPYAVILQFAFAAAWAGVEAAEDMEKLMAGGRVPFIKADKDWKTDIESLFSDAEMINRGYEGERGLDYTDYIKLFLITCGKETLIERTMDLIQINMKGRYDAMFDLRNHISGFSFSIDHSRRSYLPKVLPGIVEDKLMHLEGEYSY